MARTKFKVVKFEKKSFTDANEIVKDVSELSLQTETGEIVILPLDKIVDSPDSFGLFKFLHDGSEFTVKKNEQFALPTEADRKYKVIDISATEALIQSSDSGENIRVPLLEAATP